MMKLKMLVVAAGLAALPIFAGAQTPMDTTMKGMAKKEGESTATEKHEMKAAAKKHRAARAEQMENMAMKTPPMDGTSCPMKCPSSKGAAGLTGPQFLALQQELRDRGCGNAHVTGWMDSPTRRAIATCAKKMNVANKAAAVLVAMNIGYSDADVSAGKM